MSTSLSNLPGYLVLPNVLLEVTGKWRGHVSTQMRKHFPMKVVPCAAVPATQVWQEFLLIHLLLSLEDPKCC